MIWDPKRIKVMETHVGNFSIFLLCKIVGVKEEWVFTPVYGHVLQQEKEALWEELDNVGRAWSCPWLLTGDFNAVKPSSERSNGKAARWEREKFKELIDEHKLMEFDINEPNSRMGMMFPP